MPYIVGKPDISTEWWELAGEAEVGPESALARNVCTTVADIETRQWGIHRGNRTHAELYAGYVPTNLATGARESAKRAPIATTKGIIRSICDTAHALIGRVRPKPTPITDGADFDLQLDAHELDKFLVGAYVQADLYGVVQECFRDSTIFGTGVWKLVPKRAKKQICVERVQVDNLIVDELECPSSPSQARNWYEYQWIHVADIKRKYPQFKNTNFKFPVGASTESQRQPPKNHVLAIEAYHVDKEGECWRALVVGDTLLEIEKWPHNFAPYVVIYWVPPVSGFYGDGIAYRQSGRQTRVSYMYKWIHRVQELVVAPRVFTEGGIGPQSIQLNNEIGTIVRSRGKIQVETPQGVTAEIYGWLDKLERGGHEDEGISMASASNQLPPGIESAPAQREYIYKEGTRFAPVSQRYETAIADDTAYKMVAMYAHMAKNGVSEIQVPWMDQGLFEMIDWERISDLVESGRYRFRMEASNLDSLTPSARQQAILEAQQAGALSPEQAQHMMGFPDLESEERFNTAPFVYSRWVFNQLLKLEPVNVNSFADMDKVYDTVTRGLQWAESHGCPEPILRHIRTFLEALDAAMAPPPQPGAPMGMGPDMLPPGGVEPMGPPQPGMSLAAAQGLNVPFSQGGRSDEGV